MIAKRTKPGVTQEPTCKHVADRLRPYFTYNDVNLVTEIKYPGDQTNQFWYDALMRRYAMEDSSGLSYFTWDQNGMNLLCERDASGSVVAEYTHGYSMVDGIGTAVAVKQNRFSASYYQYPIYGGPGESNILRLVDQTGATTAYFEYDANGRPLRTDVVGGTGTNRFMANSNYVDLPDSGGVLDLSRTRLRHKPTGMFLSRDPKDGLAGGYDYAANNPVGNVDPEGLILVKGEKFRAINIPIATRAVYKWIGYKAAIGLTGTIFECCDTATGIGYMSIRKPVKGQIELNAHIRIELGLGYGMEHASPASKLKALLAGPQLRLLDIKAEIIRDCSGQWSSGKISATVTARIALGIGASLAVIGFDWGAFVSASVEFGVEAGGWAGPGLWAFVAPQFKSGNEMGFNLFGVGLSKGRELDLLSADMRLKLIPNDGTQAVKTQGTLIDYPRQK